MKTQTLKVGQFLRGELLKLVYFYEFSLGTPYSNVIGRLLRANEKFQFRRVFVDQTDVARALTLDNF